MRVLAWPAVAAALLLGACTEQPQTAGRKADAKAWERPASSAFVAPGLKAGDQAAWDEQMRNRAQNQNEYSRSVAGAQ